MARGRMIDKRVGMSKKLGKVSDKAARLWFMIYPHLDKEGRIAFDDLGDLKIEIIPLLKSWTLKKLGTALNELNEIGLIKLYPNKEKIAIQFKRFRDFQTIREDREAASRVIAPGETPESAGVFRITPSLSLSPSLSLRKEGKKEEIYFDFKERKFFNIKDEDKEGWKDAYPACKIVMELKKMREWLLANPDKKKKNYRRFIVNWLIRTQEKGGTKLSFKDKRQKALDDWENKPIEEDENETSG